MPNKKLTDADKAQIVWLRREGAKTEDIAKKLQISRKTVSKILNEEGNSQMLAEYDQKLQKSMQEFLESQQGTVQSLIKQILESSEKDIAKARLGEKMKALKVLIEAFPAKQTDGESDVRFSLRGKGYYMAWREEEHPRDEDGKFTDKGGEKKSSAQRIKDVFERRKTLAKSEKKEYNNNEKERNSTEGYVLNDPESIEVVEHIERGNLYDLETLYNLPVFKRIEEKISEYDSKYGKTSKITDAERIKNRDKWVEDFLNGANGAETMPPNGAPLKRESKATIVVGLPAAGKSTTIANPLSEEQGAFILDSDEMKKLIPEYKETNGGAANAVHDESKDLMRRALKEFTEGSRKGTNLVIPIIGDDSEKINEKYINALHNAGYDVEIAYKYADTKTSANRVVARAIKTGRFIPREVVKEYDDNAIRDAYEEILGTDYNGKKVKRSKYSEL